LKRAQLICKHSPTYSQQTRFVFVKKPDWVTVVKILIVVFSYNYAKLLITHSHKTHRLVL